MPGPRPRQHEHKRRYTSFTHPLIVTRRIWMDDCEGQMIFGDLMGLKLPDICLTGEEKHQVKNLTQETCPDRGSNLGPLRDRCPCHRLLHIFWLYIYVNTPTFAGDATCKIYFLANEDWYWYTHLLVGTQSSLKTQFTFPNFSWRRNVKPQVHRVVKRSW